MAADQFKEQQNPVATVIPAASLEKNCEVNVKKM
jgi:hypothetical protein